MVAPRLVTAPFISRSYSRLHPQADHANRDDPLSSRDHPPPSDAGDLQAHCPIGT